MHPLFIKEEWKNCQPQINWRKAKKKKKHFDIRKGKSKENGYAKTLLSEENVIRVEWQEEVGNSLF